MSARQHPAWCDLELCTFDDGRGAHWSRPIEVDTGRTGVVVQVWLEQYAPMDGYPKSGRPMILVHGVDTFEQLGDEAEHVVAQLVVQPDVARQLAHALIGAADRLGGEAL